MDTDKLTKTVMMSLVAMAASTGVATLTSTPAAAAPCTSSCDVAPPPPNGGPTPAFLKLNAAFLKFENMYKANFPFYKFDNLNKLGTVFMKFGAPNTDGSPAFLKLTGPSK
ncbi:hypothetical protein [Mycolicibacterium sp. CBMA 226]|uniref:hypothetical protein n=1 Tax=Mycolicibacterium sp. CBMA 226 TaxID=2606611 RepID=UPI0012DD3D15|nr:hypothetical protein [Mycolicibacterium sp. CBMA 226]MUL76270.1 hypothetical protein [Mycolicibacterium sp. CBMA 226]